MKIPVLGEVNERATTIAEILEAVNKMKAGYAAWVVRVSSDTLEQRSCVYVEVVETVEHICVVLQMWYQRIIVLHVQYLCIKENLTSTV